jgi:hypothetical protein
MTERELARAAAHRLAIIRHAQEVTGNVALTCRYYGIRMVELRRRHPRWRPRRLDYEFARKGADPVPSQSSIYRIPGPGPETSRCPSCMRHHGHGKSALGLERLALLPGLAEVSRGRSWRNRTNCTETCMRTGSSGDFHVLPSPHPMCFRPWGPGPPSTPQCRETRLDPTTLRSGAAPPAREAAR